MRVKSVAVAVLLSVLAGTALAQDVKQREPVMKEIGAAFSQLNRMNRGQIPYDAAAARAAFEKVAASGATFATLFGSDPTPAGEALPAIWENKADFDQRLHKLVADAKAGAATQDEAGFKTAFAAMQPDCGGCHKIYRK